MGRVQVNQSAGPEEARAEPYLDIVSNGPSFDIFQYITCTSVAYIYIIAGFESIRPVGSWVAKVFYVTLAT